MRNAIAGWMMALALCAGTGSVAFAQDGAKEETKKAGAAAKEAGKDAGDAAKHVGKATAKATKKGANIVKKAVTGDAHATCIDGTVQAGKTEASAAAGCATHGGVAKN
jgi:hypothetical protein